MTTHNFPEDQKVGRICLTLTQEVRIWYVTLNAQQQQLTWGVYETSSGNSILNLAALENNTSMHGDLFNLMKLQI